jgi:hypothetical protein
LALFENSSGESGKQSTEFLAESAKGRDFNGYKNGTAGVDDM